MSAQMQNRAHSAKVTNFTKHLRMLEVCYKAYNLYKYLVQTPSTKTPWSVLLYVAYHIPKLSRAVELVESCLWK